MSNPNRHRNTAKAFPSQALLLALISVLLWQNANAARFFTDQFAYADGANLGSTTGGGGATWTGDYSQIMVTGASTQTAPGGYPTAAGLGVAVTPTGSRKQTGVAFNGTTGIPIADGNVVYASFLLNVRTLPIEAQGNQRVAYMHSVAASQAAIEVVVSSAGQVGIQKKGSGTTFVSGTPVSSPGTHLVVMRYAFQSGNDEVAVWVDPDSDSYGVDSAPTIGAFASTTGGGSDMTAAITYFFIEAPAVTGPVYWMDEVRVGTTWAEVTSSGEVASPKPVVTQLLLAPQGLIVRGSNGSPGGVYQVIASTNLNLASSNWPAISSHTFDAVGNFGVTNPVSPGQPPQFIRLVFGGTNPPVPTAPVITSQPQGLTVAVGATTNMLVGATGTAPLAYFWLFNTNTAVGGNSNTLALVNVQTNQAGSYRVIVSNGVGTVTSSVATLTVLVPPAITAHPTNLTVVAGGSAAFNVSATGTAPLRYQWYFNTNTPIANATNATLALNPVNATNAGSYSVTVTNAVGIATSSVATLTVLGPPVITAQPQSQSVAVSNDATFTVTAAGTAPLTYKWYFNTNTAVGGNSNMFTVLNAQTNHAGTYSVIVTNTYGAVTSAFATLTVASPPSVIPGVIVDDTWADGTRSDTALPAESQWFASSSSSLTVAPGAMTGITGGSSSRTWWTYFTTNPTSPVQLGLGDTLKVTVSFTPTGVNANNTSGALRLGLYDFSNGNRTTSDGISPDGSDVTGYMLGMNFGTTLTSEPLGIYKRSNITGGNLLSSVGDYDLLSAGGGVADAPGFSNGVPYTLEFTVTREAAAVTITTTFANGSGWSISHTATDTNSGFVGSFDGFAMRPANTTQTATNFTFTRFKVELLTSGPVAPSITIQPQAQTVTAGQSATFMVSAAGTVPMSYQWYFNDTNLLVGATDSMLTLNNVQAANAGGYKVVVTNDVGSVTSATASLTVNLPTAPSITAEPTNLVVTAGQNASFAVGVSGSTPLSYQWYFNTNTLLANATNATLAVSNAQAPDAGGYSVRITNSVGAVTSRVAMLTVNPAPPFIITQPQSQTVTVSNNATFTVLAGGTAPLRYKWHFNTNSVLAGATNASLTITNSQTNNAGTYSVVITNSVASLTSAVATLTVVSAPAGGGEIYVATNGLDTNPGTLAQPTTLTKAVTLVQPGGTIYLRGGNYAYSVQITLERTNTGAGELLRKRIFAYPGEVPVLDFSSQPYGDTSKVSNPRGLQINGHYWHIKGLEVMGSADNGIFVAGNSNIIERCVTHHNRDSGLQIARYSSTVGHPEWPAYNLILNCDSHDNFDSPPNGGENADGFACKLTSGPGNVFRGCISHNNIDDGWDLFTKSDTGPIDPVTIDQCVAYANGLLTDGTINANGDRNGFKLGGSSIAVNHIVTRSIAFSNLHNGFTWNSNPGQIRMVNNFAFDNTLGNYKFDVEGPIFINNLSFWQSLANDQSDRHGVSGSPATPSNCWWDKSKTPPSINGQGIVVTAADFVSLAPPAGGFTRNADGSVNLGSFGKLAASSPLIGAGDVPVLPNPGELPFEAATYYLGDPDIGAVESGP